jgi:uncharacterized protein (TIGR03083 family)
VSTEAWDTRSLCDEWTVRDVVAHMTATSKMSGPKFFPKLVGAGFSFGRMQAKDIAAERGTSPADTLAGFKTQLDSTGRPPGPLDTMLGEVVIHSEDIRRPLGIDHTYPIDAVIRVADFFKGSNLIIGSKKRIAGLTLAATDAEWRHGEGPLVSGSMIDLVVAMTGRKAALTHLTGDGVQQLASRP